jgi:hypothetical protein
MIRRGALISLLVIGAVVSSAAAAASNSFSGRTSQSGRAYHISFVVAGAQVHHTMITWHAACATNKSLTGGTVQGNTVIRIHYGSWSSTGGYSAKLPHTAKLTGHFYVLRNTGQLTDAHHAHGTFRLRVVIDRAGHQIDHCDTGSIHWSATSAT